MSSSYLSEAIGVILLFVLVLGMSATVDIPSLQVQVQNQDAIITVLILQFVVVPLFGFLTVRLLKLDEATGLVLLVITSSPGGSFSNWWCSLFNADLALSVTMTAISTLVSVLVMPWNLYIYATACYKEQDILELLHWAPLLFTLVTVLSGIGIGLLLSHFYREPDFNLKMNRMGNIAGLCLVVFTTLVANLEQQVWNREWQFYVGVALPCFLALITANIVVWVLQFDKPQRVTVAVETCFQNTAIATSVALNMFQGQWQSKAIAVPFWYGMVEAVTLLLYCVTAWQVGWTKAPRGVGIWKMLTTSYEVLEASKADIDPDYQAYCSSDEYAVPVNANGGGGSGGAANVHSSPHHANVPRGSPTGGAMIDPDALMTSSARNKEFSAA